MKRANGSKQAEVVLIYLFIFLARGFRENAQNAARSQNVSWRRWREKKKIQVNKPIFSKDVSADKLTEPTDTPD